MSKRSIRRLRHRTDITLPTFAEKVWLGGLAKQVKDGKVTREEAHNQLHVRVPHLLGKDHHHAHAHAEEEVVVGDEVNDANLEPHIEFVEFKETPKAT